LAGGGHDDLIGRIENSPERAVRSFDWRNRRAALSR
jgi:hypothetical protein